jgi:hypothetical protein
VNDSEIQEIPANQKPTIAVVEKTEKKAINKAIVIVKYRSANDSEMQDIPANQKPTTAVVEILDEAGLNNLLNSKKDATFKTIECVQTVLKDPVGIGKLI